ncbi:MAG: hypothetical protein N2246_00315 [Candidatus Sumerlaeia bacterium]|nr:hypothetical protein [Candidatus Sumerlaeia bacterium]
MERKIWYWLFALMPFMLIVLLFVSLLLLPRSIAPTQPEELISISLNTESVINPGNELLLLPDDRPLLLKLTLRDDIEVAGYQRLKTDVQWQATAGKIETVGPYLARWSAREQSVTARINAIVTLTYRESKLAGLLGKTFSVSKSSNTLLVLSPLPQRFLKNGIIDGFKMGEYPDPYKAAKQVKRANSTSPGTNVSQWFRMYPQKFLPPDFFYKVTAQNKNFKISPNYTLGDFTLDYPWFSLGLPQYIALDYNLIRKLEDLQTLLEQAGYSFKKFKFIYGFRPPSFNLGNPLLSKEEENLKAPFSMHQYGRAADIIIDNNNDNVMDDLNNDGKIDINDAKLILRFVDQLDRKYKAENSPLIGGAGDYSHHDFKGRVQSPYVHIDVRGFVRPDGSLIRWSIP